MRSLALIAMLAVSQPLMAQDLQAPRPVGSASIGNPQLIVPPPAPSSIAELQQTIDKTMGSAASTVMVMDLDQYMLSRAPISAINDFDGTLRRLVANLKSIQLRMFDVEGDVRSKIRPVRDLLKSPNWVRYSAYTSRTEEVEVWSARSGNSQMGVFLLSVSGRRVFMMNVGGPLGPDQLVYLSGLFGIPNFKPKLEMPLDAPAPAK